MGTLQWLEDGNVIITGDRDTGYDVVNTADLLVALGMAKSKSEAKRLIAQGAVTCRLGEHTMLTDSLVLKVGKLKWVRVVLVEDDKDAESIPA